MRALIWKECRENFKWAHADLVFGFGALMVFSAVLCAVLCFVLARRYAFSRVGCMGWSVMGVSFGWVGLVLLLTLLESLARIPCPKCRKLRVVTRAACEHCGTAHAVPVADGTEIFEPTTPIPQPALATRCAWR
jgi:hypothetical protein